MTELVLQKLANGSFVPVDESSKKYLNKIPVGQGITGKFKRHRNPGFHRKYFVLLHYAFDMWTPAVRQYKGMVVHKEFEQFRNDIVVLSGHYETSVNLNGDVRLRAKSLAFDSMDQEEFQSVYEATITVILDRILANYTRQDLDNAVAQIMSFA